MIELTTERGTPEWRLAHRGRLTASDMPALFTRRGSKTYDRLVERLVLDFEGVGLHTDEHPDPWAEAHEVELTGAVARYGRAMPGSTIARTGFIQDSLFTWLGATPHALVDTAGCVYVRCRRHLRTWHEKKSVLEVADMARVQITMRVCDRAWCDVVDYWDGGSGIDKIARRRVPVDPAFFTVEVLPRCVLFWQSVSQVRARRGRGAPAP